MLEREIDDFGRRLGLPGLELESKPGGGSVSLVIGGGVLTLKTIGDGLVLSLAVKDEPFDSRHVRRILERCSWQRAGGTSLSAGWYGGSLVASVRHAGDATSADMENSLRLLLQVVQESVQER